MPKDGESNTSTKIPLKRGDACLYCRKRRIRCSAEKPTCQHCKGKRDCVYDNGKPVSRVKQLEDKVAQLEGLLRGDASGSGSRRPSEEEGMTQPPLRHHSSDNSSTSQPAAQTQDFSMEGFDIDMLQQSFGDVTGGSGLSNDFFTFGGSMFGPTEPSKLPDVVAQSMPADPATMFDFSTLDPNFMSLVNSFDNTFQSQQQSAPTFTQPPAQTAPMFMQPNQQQQVSSTFAQSPQQGQATSGLAQSLSDFGPTITSMRQQFQDPASSLQPSQYQQQTPQFSQPSAQGPASTSSGDASTGLTPFLNNDYSPTNPDPSPPVTSGYASAADLAPTPGHHFEHLSKTVSYNVHGGALPTAAEANGTAALNPGVQSIASTYDTLAGEDEVDEVIAQALGTKTLDDSYPGTRTEGSGGGFSSSFRMPADSRGGKGADLDQEGFELVGGWFDANDLPRVARDHL